MMLLGSVKAILFLSTPSARRATSAIRKLGQSTEYFYPRPPRGGRRRGNAGFGVYSPISIHALREEGDLVTFADISTRPYFYPRPPRGGRRNTSYQRAVEDIFLSTPSARRATNCAPPPCLPVRYFYPRPPRGGRRRTYLWERNEKGISIHALREEGDRSGRTARRVPCHFYPRPPRGGRPELQRIPHIVNPISIHALREEGDLLPLLPSRQ